MDHGHRRQIQQASTSDLQRRLHNTLAQETLNSGITVTVTTNNNAADADVIAGGINGAGFTNIVASVDSQNRVVIEHNDGGEFKVELNFADISISDDDFIYADEDGIVISKNELKF